VVVLLPNLVGYGLLAVRALRRSRSAGVDGPRGGPRAREDRPGAHTVPS
jgi:hypothetical protein